jgi:transketolase
MKKNENVWLLTGDLGFHLWDEIERDYPGRYLNCGASEQAMLDVAVGLALKGQIPFVYSITSFLLYRPFEAIRNYLHYEKIPVKLIGSGRDKEYGGLGLTHWAHDDKVTMAIFPNIKSYWPEKQEVGELVRKAVIDKSPYYINLSKL